MQLQLTPTFFILFLGSAISLCVGFFAWSRRSIAGALPLSGFAISVAFYTFFAALEMAAIGQAHKITMSKLEYIGSCLLPAFFLTFSFQYTQREKLLQKWYIKLVLWGTGIFVILAAWTNEFHHLVWTDFYMLADPVKNVLVYEHGPIFWIYPCFSFSLSIIAILLLLRGIIQKPPVYVRQTVALIVGMLIPMVGGILYITGMNPFPGVDLYALSFPFSIIALAIGIFQFNLLDLVPIARDVLVEGMVDGIIVMDINDRLIDINTAARNYFGIRGTNIVGRNSNEIFKNHPEMYLQYANTLEAEGEIIVNERPIQVLSLRISPLLNSHQCPVGKLILLHDITERKMAEKRLEFYSTHDVLTGVYNRYFYENEIRRLKRKKCFPVSVMICDLNNLKDINDQFGHTRGDEVLTQTAGLLRNTFRDGDTIARIGGDEFAILLPKTCRDAALEILERLKRNIAIFNRESKRHPVDIAIGMETCEKGDDLRQIILRADDRMYDAKKNRSVKKDDSF